MIGGRDNLAAPPPGRGLGERASWPIRRYLWPCEDPRVDIAEAATPGGPSPAPLPSAPPEEEARRP